MTLAEILVATLIFCLALTGVLGSLTSISTLIDLAKETTIATNNLKNMMERTLTTSYATMLTRFPNGSIDGPVSNPYATIAGGYTLRNEHITTTYANIAADPLELKATLAWIDSRGRTRNISMSIFKSR